MQTISQPEFTPQDTCEAERVIARRGTREVRYAPASSERVTGEWGVGWRRVRALCYLYDIRTQRRRPLFTGTPWAARFRAHISSVARWLGISRRTALAIDPMKTTVFDARGRPIE